MVNIKDLYGEVELDENSPWGVNTQRSIQNFPIGSETMPEPLIRSILQLKKACAAANLSHGRLEQRYGEAIMEACDDVLNDPQCMRYFPLSVWQTGSGTQTNMNANEVIARRAMKRHPDLVVHANDHVNCGQSSNDIFPTAMHMMAVSLLKDQLLPALHTFKKACDDLAGIYENRLKIGRTHLQDAVPLTFGNEVSAWSMMVTSSIEHVEATLPSLYALAIGGTAVGTGLNTYKGFDHDVCKNVSESLGFPFLPSPNKFHAMSSKDAMVFAHGAIQAWATNYLKIVNDVRWLASGPRCGLNEIFIPANEAGSSIMPGKVNPTQCESASMVCYQVMANHAGVTMGASHGNFQLNTYMPLIAYNFCQSIQLLSDSMESFLDRCFRGIRVNEPVMQENVNQSLMTATFLNRTFGYDKTSAIVKEAYENNTSIKAIVLKHGYMEEKEFDLLFDIDKMIEPDA